jgi:hypothetical protein
MYLTGRSPYLDSSLLCSNYRNIIGVIPLGNHSTAETVRSYIYLHYLAQVQSPPYSYSTFRSISIPLTLSFRSLGYRVIRPSRLIS